MPTPPYRLDLAKLDALSDEDLRAEIDLRLRAVTAPGILLDASPGAWLAAMVLLSERAARSARKAERLMLWLTKAVAWMTLVVTISTVIGVWLTWHAGHRADAPPRAASESPAQR